MSLSSPGKLETLGKQTISRNREHLGALPVGLGLDVKCPVSLILSHSETNIVITCISLCRQLGRQGFRRTQERTRHRLGLTPKLLSHPPLPLWGSSPQFPCTPLCPDLAFRREAGSIPMSTVGLRTGTTSLWCDISRNRGWARFCSGQNSKGKEEIIFLSVVAEVGWKQSCSPCQIERGSSPVPRANHVKAKETAPSRGERGTRTINTWNGPMGVTGALPSCPTLPLPASHCHEPM